MTKQYTSLKLGQVIEHERGACFIAALNCKPYPGDPRPYVYVIAEHGKWSDYVLHSALYEAPRKEEEQS